MSATPNAPPAPETKTKNGNGNTNGTNWAPVALALGISAAAVSIIAAIASIANTTISLNTAARIRRDEKLALQYEQNQRQLYEQQIQLQQQSDLLARHQQEYYHTLRRNPAGNDIYQTFDE